MSLNIWHYVSFGFFGLLLVGGVIISLKQQNKKLVVPMLITVILINVSLGVFSVFVIDKYTKKVGLYKLKNKRLLSIEKIAYSGIVKNEGNYEIGEVIFKIKLVNKGHVSGNVKGENFFNPSGFFEFFVEGGGKSRAKPQTITKEFVVARNLKPGKVKAFRVYFDYPPYFKSVSYFASVSGH